MIYRTFYAIYDPVRKKFKGRGNISGARWTDEPTQTYDTKGRAEGALKSHIRAHSRHWSSKSTDKINLCVREVYVSWEE